VRRLSRFVGGSYDGSESSAAVNESDDARAIVVKNSDALNDSLKASWPD